MKLFRLGVASLLMMGGMASILPVFAADVVRLEVIITPSTIKTHEFTDVTIKALDADGKVVTNYGQNNDGDIMMYLEEYGNKQESPDFILPWSGFYFFEAADQGIKIFSKGFTVLKPGTYTLKVTELFNTNIKGEAKITVTGSGTWPSSSSVKVDSPIDGSTIATDALTIIGTTQLPNTPLSIFIDGGKVQESISDENANFTVIVKWVAAGGHVLEVKALDLSNSVIGTSGPIGFTYQPTGTSSGDFFVKLDIQPGKTVNEWDLVTFIITTKPTVSSASIALWQGVALPAQKVQNGLFQKQMTVTAAGVYPVHLSLTAEWTTKEYKNVDTLTVLGMVRKILTLTPTMWTDPTTIGLNWTFTGAIERFKIAYGTDKELMNMTAYATKPEAVITRVKSETTVYVQVFPVDENGIVNGEPSPIVTIWGVAAGSFSGGTATNTNNGEVTSTTGHSTAEAAKSTCFPWSIVLKTRKVDDQYYLYWQSVPHAKSYIVYRIDTRPNSIQEMAKVWEVTDTEFPYPFDPDAEADQYAWYAVEAVCDNGDQKIVDAIKKVKVWPVDTIIVLVLVTLLLFGLRRLSKGNM